MEPQNWQGAVGKLCLLFQSRMTIHCRNEVTLTHFSPSNMSASNPLGYIEGKPIVDADSDTDADLLFDEQDYHDFPLMAEIYPDKKECHDNSALFRLNLTELFIFTGKYSVPQLRGDVLTGFVGQCWNWQRFPAAQVKAVIRSMATNLPASSKLKIPCLRYSLD